MQVIGSYGRWSDLGPVVLHGVAQTEVVFPQLVGLHPHEVVSRPRGEYVPVPLAPLRTPTLKPDMGVGKEKDENHIRFTLN